MNNALLSLLQLTDLTLPIGGFSHSAGLETYVQQFVVHDTVTATAFVRGMLGQNIFYTDATLMSLAYDYTQNGNFNALITLDEYGTAIKLPREIREASQKLGIRLLKVFHQQQHEGITRYREAMQQGSASGHYAIAFGMLAAVLKIFKMDALTGFYYNSAAGMVTNCVKLIPLGQQDGQQLLFSLHPLITELVEKSMVPDLDKLGICCAGFDIRSMQHEQLYSRLYMS